jgi:hypothetical protein
MVSRTNLYTISPPPDPSCCDTSSTAACPSQIRNHLPLLILGSIQEKVEEDRYIRARETELRESKAKAAAAEAKAKEMETKSAELVAKKTAAMNEVAALLAKTGDVVSEAGLANLADWKH